MLHGGRTIGRLQPKKKPGIRDKGRLAYNLGLGGLGWGDIADEVVGDTSQRPISVCGVGEALCDRERPGWPIRNCEE
jgi:hypothetical protein